MEDSGRGEITSKTPRLTVVMTKDTSIHSSHRRSSDGGFDSRRGSLPTTPTTAHTFSASDIDLEAMKPARCSDHWHRASCGNELDTSIWPRQAHWKEKAKAAKRQNRNCQCMAGLSKRTQIMIKIAIILFIIGVAIGVGFGISKPLGATIWHPKDGQ
ncbi:hypothetical protein GGS20DRAFT_589046 [Poronia punctata]|nr:hypothetical protein GGS20DRAFT_589046 [Poronia punctata]